MTVLETIQDQMPRLRHDFHVKQIGLFGSYARGEQRRSSDIDLLVDFETGHRDYFNLIRLRFHLQETLGRDVDVVTRASLKPGLRRQVLSEVRYA
ncbi:MAG: nucleotidyltransferase family protein [Candidatus Geothermincolia bacterium]